MCGIAGFWQSGRSRTSDAGLAVQAMAAAIHHRGPDASGAWIDHAAGVALGHRRLSILELSVAGHQPMLSACGRYVLIFNGEIYNHLDLREQLGSHAAAAGALGQEPAEHARPAWRGHSDTETLLQALSTWGVQAALSRSVGMFAFALWDRKEQRLTLARDRMGEKPLYYGWQNDVFLFGSELKALRAYPAFSAEVDRNALSLFLRHSCVPAPYTVYRGIYKLPPGTYLTVSRGEKSSAPVSYWSAREVALHGQGQPFQGDAPAALDKLLRKAVEAQMVADVPLGAFLSGGIDSSTVVALMQAQSGRPVKTFSIGFWSRGYDEAPYAKAVARYLGTEHTELYVTEQDALAVVADLPAIYDEPFADSSQIPTLLVSKLAREHVTVSLSGDGGDELFGGYNRYFWAVGIWRKLGWLPKPLRAMFAWLLTGLGPQAWNAVFDLLGRFLPLHWRYASPGDKLHKLAEILALTTPEQIYYHLVSHWKHPEELLRGAQEPKTILTDTKRWADVPDFEHRMMYLDLVSYLPDDILVKVDRAAMNVSLETRVPFLDHRVVEFAWRLPLSMKLRNGQGKWLLRQVLYNYVPRALIERSKMGFGVPLDAWLRGPLRPWAEALLDESRLRTEGFFDPGTIRQKWAEHLGGQRNWAYCLWDILMFQMWLESWG